jgi:glycosyltransferase involved in cell wall biosynthesis
MPVKVERPDLLSAAGNKRPAVGKPRVCFLRGSYLNAFEAQYLRPLQDAFDLTAAHPRSHRFDVASIGLPRRKLSCLDYLNGLIPRKIAGRPVPNALKFLGYEEVLLGVDRLVKDFDLIHLPEQSFFFTWQVASRKPRFGFRILVTQAEVNPYWYPPVVAKRAEIVRSRADLFIARSNRARAALICEGVKSEKIRVIGHGVDIDRFRPGPRNAELCSSLGIDRNRFIVLFVGRLVWTKGLYALVDAAKLLSREPVFRRRDPLFLIVGDGPERPSLEARIKQLNLQRSFIFAGDQPYRRLPDLHRLADVFVLPSISTRYILEQFGIALIEAMATGTPVVATHCGAMDEVVGRAGLLVQPNDYLRLGEALLRLLDDGDLRAELGQLGVDRVRAKFTHQMIAEAIASAYRTALVA